MEKNIITAENLKSKTEKDKKQLEQELDFAKKQMSQALDMYTTMRKETTESINARSIFLSKLSHEVRTPMNALIGFSDLILACDTDQTVKNYAKGIKRATNRLLNIYNDLVEISKIENGNEEFNLEEFDTSKLLGNLIYNAVNNAEEKALDFVYSIQEDMPSVIKGDFDHIYQAVANILENAVRFTNKGKVEFNVTYEKLQDDSIIKIIFETRDTGVGIKKEDQERLFEAFNKFGQKHLFANEGQGIGLVVSRYLLKKMGGDIVFESKYGKGSTFVCSVECQTIDKTPVNLENVNVLGKGIRGRFTAKNARVLIVDDTKVNLVVEKNLLKTYLIDAKTASGGLEAVEMCKSEEFDIIFMDHMMPDLNGVEAAKRIRKLGGWRKNVPIIALTANTTDEAKKLYKESGMQDFLAKPVSIPFLHIILKKWIPYDLVDDNDGADSGENQSKESQLKNENGKEQSPALNYGLLKEAGIDINVALPYFGGNTEAYMETLAEAYKDFSKKLPELEKSVYLKDTDSYAINAHSIKSVAASLGNPELSEMAKAHELSAKSGDLDYIEKNSRNFIKKCEKFMGDIKMIINDSKEVKDRENTGSDVIWSKSISDKVSEAANLVSDFETDSAVSIIREILEENIPKEKRNRLDKVLELIDDFQYDAAVNILKETGQS